MEGKNLAPELQLTAKKLSQIARTLENFSKEIDTTISIIKSFEHSSYNHNLNTIEQFLSGVQNAVNYLKQANAKQLEQVQETIN
ncbi:MAG: hypothetical protein ACTSRW_08510 [Candidatus Helarchaeota archaeon]